ncbi:dicarboxylate transporter/tellurite-resistance protein TehA [Paraburkholderia sp. BCC1884]|uniref:SLAC1 family transporter n=1 Tax=Paraburkholderia sp. BCC1884 TaxID=2562668 RepID=UPI0011842291|nr:dicarboxylate transporter/tellurite-resistance protein TehA [Paraburkholderia sp. BCC1884]
MNQVRVTTNNNQRRTRTIPVSFFGIAVGILATANAWRVASRSWHLPIAVFDALAALGLAVWLTLMLAYGYKWVVDSKIALFELEDPIKAPFASLLPVSSLLSAGIIYPHAPRLAVTIYVLATLVHLALGLMLQGRIWKGGMDSRVITTAVYLPVVAPTFVGASCAAQFGWPQLAAILFGAGMFFWIANESMIMHCAATNPSTPACIRPLLGLQLAPSVVGGGAYLNLNNGVPDLFAYALLGYGLYQVLLLLRLLPWIRRQIFTPSYWAFSFGVAALPTMAMRMQGQTGFVHYLSIVLFAASNLTILTLAWKTVWLAMLGTLFHPDDPTCSSRAIDRSRGT